jgi:hypothetical protein
MKPRVGLGLWPVVMWLVLCLVVAPLHAKKPEDVVLAQEEIPEDLLLDVGIQILDPGLPEEDPDSLEEQRIYAGVRKSEARFIPYHLKNTLESTGHWGAVRVVPAGVQAGELRVSGEILLSTGKALVIRILAVDSSGRVWREKKYKQDANGMAYREGDDQVEIEDPYQDLYDRIANDLLEARQKLTVEEIHALRDITRIKFAADLVPEAFGDYLSVDKKGRYQIDRLPSAEDPMLDRLALVRERDYLFVDTLNEYYSDFYARMSDPYDKWRSNSYDEELQLQEIRREARMQKIFGGILLLGAALADGGSSAARVARDAAAISGVIVLKNGIDKGKEAKINREALGELVASLNAELEPVLVEIDGQTVRLEGSAEAQYAEWRRMLGRIFTTETGFSPDPDADVSLERADVSEN